MGAWARKLLLFSVLSVVGRRTFAQDAIIGNSRPCEQLGSDHNSSNPTDNLSCPNINPNILECYRRDQLCNGLDDCTGGSDESTNLVALQCDPNNTPRGNFACSLGETVQLTALCDGNRDCTGGGDETTTLCESE